MTADAAARRATADDDAARLRLMNIDDDEIVVVMSRLDDDGVIETVAHRTHTTGAQDATARYQARQVANPVALNQKK